MSGIFVQDIEGELPRVIKNLEERPCSINEFGAAGYEQYKKKFTYEVISSKLSEIVGAPVKCDAMEPKESR